MYIFRPVHRTLTSDSQFCEIFGARRTRIKSRKYSKKIRHISTIFGWRFIWEMRGHRVKETPSVSAWDTIRWCNSRSYTYVHNAVAVWTYRVRSGSEDSQFGHPENKRKEITQCRAHRQKTKPRGRLNVLPSSKMRTDGFAIHDLKSVQARQGFSSWGLVLVGRLGR